MKKIIIMLASLGLIMVALAVFININTPSFNATIVQIFEDGRVVVEPLQDGAILIFGERASFNTTELSDIEASIGDIVSIRAGRTVRQSDPTIIDARRWSMVERYE